MSFIVYNPNYGIFTRVQVVFFFSRGGRVWKRIDLQSLHTDAIASLFAPSQISHFVTIFAAFVWCGLGLQMIVSELGTIKQTIAAFGWTGLKERYITDLWNFVDWFSICNTIVVVVYFFRLRALAASANDAAMGVLDVGTDGNKLEAAVGYRGALETALDTAGEFRVLFSVYSIMIILRLFKAFSAQPRLAMVSNTLFACLNDVAHFFVVFCSIYFMYSVCGVVLFGHRVAEFSSVGRSLFATWFVIMGEMDWYDLHHAAGKFLAGSWVI